MFIIYFDMDGVLCDFDKRCKQLDCRKPNGKCNWEKMDAIGQKFWADMDKIDKGIELLTNVLSWFASNSDVQIGIFSAVHLKNGKLGKMKWLEKYLPMIDKGLIKIINNGKFKFQYANSDSLLVDDKEENVKNWKNAGGYAVHFNMKDSNEYMMALIYGFYSHWKDLQSPARSIQKR